MLVRFIGALLILSWGQAWSAPCASGLPDRLVPKAGEQGIAMFPEEIVHAKKYQPPQKMADRGFDHLVGMWNAVTVYPCDRGRSATIEFESFEVVRLDPLTKRLIPELSLRFDSGAGSAFAGGGQWKRLPEWWISGSADRSPTVTSRNGGVFKIDLRAVPENILHMWTDRIKAVPGHVYGVRMRVRITGDARLQPAMDYWRGASSNWTGWSPDCVQPAESGQPANNCEAWLGDWLGDTGGKFVTVTSPRSLLGKQID